MNIKNMAKRTIRNATKQELADFVARLTQDIPDTDLSIVTLRMKARECERKSIGWYGTKVTFEEWVNS